MDDLEKRIKDLESQIGFHNFVIIVFLCIFFVCASILEFEMQKLTKDLRDVNKMLTEYNER